MRCLKMFYTKIDVNIKKKVLIIASKQTVCSRRDQIFDG